MNPGGVEAQKPVSTAHSSATGSILSIDYGRERMGLAIANANTPVAQPLAHDDLFPPPPPHPFAHPPPVLTPPHPLHRRHTLPHRPICLSNRQPHPPPPR